jgi:hypothetical protein
MDKKRNPDFISQRNPLSLARGKVAQVKIILTPSSVYKDEKWQNKNQVFKLKFILMCFYFSLEYRLSYYKEEHNMVILTKPKWSKSFYLLPSLPSGIYPARLDIFIGFQNRGSCPSQTYPTTGRIYLTDQIFPVIPRVMETLIKVISKWIDANTILNPKVQFKN